MWVPSSISSAPAVHRGAICRACAPRGGGRCLVVVGGDACRVRAPRGARPGLVSVGALVVGSGLDGGGRCLVVVGGGACRLSAPRGARHSIVVDGALVVGPFVDLVRMSSWAPCHILSGLLVFAPGKSCFLKPSFDGLRIDRGPGVATATPMSRCPPLCVCRSIWRRHCVWSLSSPRVAEAGGVTLQR